MRKLVVKNLHDREVLPPTKILKDNRNSSVLPCVAQQQAPQTTCNVDCYGC